MQEDAPSTELADPAVGVEPASFTRVLERALGYLPGDLLASGVTDLSPAAWLKLSRAPARRVAVATGLRVEDAQRLVSAFELGRRIERVRCSHEDSVRAPGGVYRLMAPRMRGLERETLFVIALDGRHRVTGCHRVSEGTLTMALVHPREVYSVAVRESAAAVIVSHNHPSGDPEPSAEDFEVTRRLADAGKLLGVPLLDHVIVGHGAYTSLRERMDL